MTLVLDLPPDLERRVEEEAARVGQAPADFLRAVVEERLAAAPVSNVGPVLDARPLPSAGEETQEAALERYRAMREEWAKAGIHWNGERLRDREPIGRTRPGKTLAEIVTEDRR